MSVLLHQLTLYSFPFNLYPNETTVILPVLKSDSHVSVFSPYGFFCNES